MDGFKAGADDYLGKPFHVEELVARLGALVRRGGGQSGSRIRAGELILDEDTRTARVGNGEPVELTATEFRLLRYLMSHPHKVLSKTQLHAHIYDEEADRDSNLIEVYIRRLRRKLGEARIATVRGQGYVFKVTEE